MSSILSDELLSHLVAVGEVDLLVGVPTLNHSDTVGAVVRAAHVAFNRELARERTALVNVDGGSVDGTPEIVRDASIVERETLLTSQSLRTRHRVSAPYHGVPGKASALRTIFAAADLVQARALVVLDPEIASVTPESVSALARPALAGEADFVSPAYARHPLEGPLVTQVVRPLFRAAYGLPLQEPLAGEFGCSRRFVLRCLDEPVWERDELRLAIDLWLSGVAAGEGLRSAEVRLGPRRLAARARPARAALVPQVLDALFTCLRLQEAAWTARAGAPELARHGEPGETPPPPPPPADLDGFALLFRDGVAALGEMLEDALRPATVLALRRAATAGVALDLPDTTWAAVVTDLAAAHRHERISRDHLVRAAVPLYLGRVAAFGAAVAGRDVGSAEESLEALGRAFERSRAELVELWTAGKG